MKVSIDWLKELVDLKVPIEEVTALIPLRTIGTKEVTKEFIELDMKGYNRADLLSMRGVAYEIAAITSTNVTFRETNPVEFIWVDPQVSEDLAPYEQALRLKPGLAQVHIKVDNLELCPVYCVAKIEGLRVQPSPTEWVKKLEDCGYRAVNNVADVTNLVMIEYGQPLHAFDARAVKDEKIIVRTAKIGERITTLDGKTRDLEISDLLITDVQNVLGIAGVMGGKDSEVTDSTSTILLEAAIFDPTSIRKTATRLKLQSEASKRFYHGLTKRRLLQALDAALRMYQQLGGRLTAITLTGNLNDQSKTVTLTQNKINSSIGVDIPSHQVESILKSLAFHLGGVSVKLKSWQVIPPYWRLDINIEEDLIEEVARIYGYEKIPPQQLRGQLPQKIDQSLFELIYNLKKILVRLGLTEVQTYSFYSTAVLNNLDLDKIQLIKIANPISSETEYLRNFIFPNLLEVVAKNLKRGFSDIAIFEIGKVYQPSKDGNPQESYRLTVALLNGSNNPTAELYQIIKKTLKPVEDRLGKGEVSWLNIKDLFHPQRVISFVATDQNQGIMAEIHPRIINRFGVEKRIAVLEINFVSLGV